jgi:hypothetical protein
MSLPEIDRICETCGAMVRRRAKYCPQCGEKISAPASDASAAGEPPHGLTPSENKDAINLLTDSNWSISTERSDAAVENQSDSELAIDERNANAVPLTREVFSAPDIALPETDAAKEETRIEEAAILTEGEAPRAAEMAQIDANVNLSENALTNVPPTREVALADAGSTSSAPANEEVVRPRPYSPPIFAAYQEQPKKLDKLARKASSLIEEGKQRAIEQFGEDEMPEEDSRFVIIAIGLFLFFLALFVFHIWMK